MRSTSAGGRHSFGYFSFAVERKVTRPTGRNHTINYTKKKIEVFPRIQLMQGTSSKPIRTAIRG
jgi:hypothetical protein